MTWETAAQQIIIGALDGNLTGCAVYDAVPFLPEAAPATNFPYCVIGDDIAVAWDTDDATGADVQVTLHFWSKASGFKEVKALMGQAYAELHRQTLTLSGYRIVDCLLDFSEAMRDPDGVTRHGVQRYRLRMTLA